MGNTGALKTIARGQRRLASAAVLAAALAVAAVPAAAEDATASQVYFGKQIYRLFCVGCHGPEGKGDGAVAQALDMPRADLTQLSRRNGGVFPAEEVAAAIAGLSSIRGHRELAMEPWAEMFAEEFSGIAERAVASERVARRIAHLLAYLESIQE